MPLTPTVQKRARAADITVPLVREVIITFYDKVRQDPDLGAIFGSILGNDWEDHIEIICAFWLKAMRLDSSYEARNFMPAHLKHQAIQPKLLPIWLGIFREIANERCSTQAAQVFIDIAEGMAYSLRIALDQRDRRMD